MKIVRAECLALDIPFYADHVVHAMHRAKTHSEQIHVNRLETDNGLVGYGRREWRFTDEAVYQFAFYKGNLPGFQEGIDLEVLEDNGSDAFAREHEALLAREATTVQDQLR